MTDDTLLAFDLPAVCREKLAIDFDDGNQSSDAGLLKIIPSVRMTQGTSSLSDLTICARYRLS
jgi:hypothetical protein